MKYTKQNLLLVVNKRKEEKYTKAAALLASNKMCVNCAKLRKIVNGIHTH